MSSSWSFFSLSTPSHSLLLPSRLRSAQPTRPSLPAIRGEKLTPLRIQKDQTNSPVEKLGLLLLQTGAIVASSGMPALAVTGDNLEEDLLTTLISAGIVAFLYFLVAPPIIMNWMRLRWYKRKFFEMYLQFMFAFIFFPGLMLWAPFLNFRKFPRDPTMQYPWSTPNKDVPLYKKRR